MNNKQPASALLQIILVAVKTTERLTLGASKQNGQVHTRQTTSIFHEQSVAKHPWNHGMQIDNVLPLTRTTPPSEFTIHLPQKNPDRMNGP